MGKNSVLTNDIFHTFLIHLSNSLSHPGPTAYGILIKIRIVKGNNSYSIYVNKNSEVINNLLIYIYILFVDNNTHVQKNHNYIRKI
jgi:hypothetical protein